MINFIGVLAINSWLFFGGGRGDRREEHIGYWQTILQEINYPRVVVVTFLDT